MFKLGKTVLSLLGVLTLSFAVVYTASATPVPQQLGPFHISYLMDANYFITQGVQNPQGIIIYPDVPSQQLCGALGAFVLDATQNNYKAQSALAMAAYLAGKPIYVNVDSTDTTAQCYGSSTTGARRVLSITVAAN